MIADHFQIHNHDDRTRLSFRVRSEAREHTIFFEWPGPSPLVPGDVAFSACLLPAIIAGDALRVDAEVSEKLLLNADRIQALWRDWFPFIKRDIVIQPANVISQLDSRPHESHTREKACFFTAGVDSFYSALHHEDAPEALIHVKGLSEFKGNQSLSDGVEANLEAAAHELELPMYMIETNLREFAKSYISWVLYFGSALGTVAHFTSAAFDTVHIGSCHPVGYPRPWGSHEKLNPLYSNQLVSITHHGDQTNRFQKIEAIANHACVHRHLWVCGKLQGEQLNCGRCEKCLRTMIALDICGSLRLSDTLPKFLDLKRVARTRIYARQLMDHVEENLAGAKRRQARPELIEVLEDMHHRAPSRFCNWVITCIQEWKMHFPQLSFLAPRFRP